MKANNKIIKLIAALKESKKSLEKILITYETYETVCDEFFRSVDCLENIESESVFIGSVQVNAVSVFIPLNLPLYSLVLFGIVPSLMSGNVFIRIPYQINSLVNQILNVIHLNELFPNIKIMSMESGLFIEGFVNLSDVVIFTGRYSNALNIQKCCFDKLFIFNGGGINPIIVTNTGKIDLAVEKIVQARIFNSGQDCAGPDAILVETKIYDEFMDKLIFQLDKIKVGKMKDKKVRVGHQVRESNFIFAKKQMAKVRKYLVYGGEILEQQQIIKPTVFSSRLRDYQNYVEFFSPVFFIHRYDCRKELSIYFGQVHYTDYAMYVSVFGDINHALGIGNSVILHNKTILDVERGNMPYGGYGPKANYIAYANRTSSRPILISKEISVWAKPKN